jgi:hypothetical protein
MLSLFKSSSTVPEMQPEGTREGAGEEICVPVEPGAVAAPGAPAVGTVVDPGAPVAPGAVVASGAPEVGTVVEPCALIIDDRGV